MARDYAKQRNPNAGRGGAASKRGPAKNAGMSGSTGLVVGLAVGLAIAVAVGAYFSINHPANKVALGQAAAPAAAAAASTASSADDDARKPIKLPPKQPSRFAFYEMLPSYEVVIPRETAKPAKPGQPPAPAPAPDVKQALAEPGQYLIQVGAYRAREEADKHRASLALIGIESRIEQVTIDQKDTWFRVRIGPEATLAKAQEVLERLESNDIKGMLIKVKG